LIEHGPHWIDFIIITFISEKKRYFRCPYKIWSKFITFDMKKKRKPKMSKVLLKKKVNLGVLGVSPYVSNGYPDYT